MPLNTKDRLFDNCNVSAMPEREFQVLNALDVSIHRCFQKYEMMFQIVAQDRTDMTQSMCLLSWELVDWLERTRKILGLGAGLKKRDPAFQLAERSLREAEDLRHILQHLDQFLARSKETDTAPLGWVSANHCLRIEDGQIIELRNLVYTPGTVRGKDALLGTVELPSMMYDKVDYVTLQLGDKSVNLSNICRKLLKYYEILRNEVANKYPL